MHHVIRDSSDEQPHMGDWKLLFFTLSIFPTTYYGRCALSSRGGRIIETLCKIEVGPVELEHQIFL